MSKLPYLLRLKKGGKDFANLKQDGLAFVNNFILLSRDIVVFLVYQAIK